MVQSAYLHTKKTKFDLKKNPPYFLHVKCREFRSI